VTKKQTQLLAEKNEQLKELNTELLSLNNDKNYFMNLAANDLKIPLQEISVLLNNTKNSFFTYDKENQKKSLKEVVNLSSKMQTIISGLLEINELDSILN
jgi:light-regulated signal transduction histidine kinase (bacteriophytochrome)